MAKLVSESIKISDFFRGLVMQHVDYSTRHYSRCYHWGVATGGTLFLLTPVAIVFGLGFLAGRYL